MGETVSASAQGARICTALLEDIQKGDIVKVITDQDTREIAIEANYKQYSIDYDAEGAAFVRVELYRSPEAGFPLLLAMISNPIYFEPRA